MEPAGAGFEACDEEVPVGQRSDPVGDRRGDVWVGVGVVGALIAEKLQGRLGVGLKVFDGEVLRGVQINQLSRSAEGLEEVAVVVDSTGPNDDPCLVLGEGLGDRDGDLDDGGAGLARACRFVDRIDDEVERPALLVQHGREGGQEVVELVRERGGGRGGDLAGDFERGLAFGVHRAGDRAERGADRGVLRWEGRGDAGIGGRDDPAEDGGLAHPG
jgi:hypothetical protein